MKATIINTVENTTNVVDLPEAVTDLSGLKHFLEINEGQFFEGATHTDLTSDGQALPELPESKKERGYVFYVSPVQNKIKNGAYDRKTCYRIIKEQNLGNKVKEEFNGRNFTQVGTDALNKFIEINADVNGSEEIAETPAPVEDVDAGKITTEKDLWNTIIGVLETLGVAHDTLDGIIEGINRVFPNPYSVQDISNMRK